MNDVPLNISSLKPEFLRDYISGEFWDRDPAVVMASEVLHPYFWRDSYTAAERGRLPINEWRDVDDLARSHGYRDGFVIPLRTRVSRFFISLFSTGQLQASEVERDLFPFYLVGLAFDDRLRAGRNTGARTGFRSVQVDSA